VSAIVRADIEPSLRKYEDHEAITEVGHVATDRCPVLAFRRKPGVRRQAASPSR
jgi:hypothetical protein